MTGKSHIIAGLDVGTSTTTVVAAQIHSDGAQEILGVGVSNSQGLRKGVVINIEATVDSIRQAIQQAEKMAGAEITSVFASLSGSHIQGLNSNGVVGIKSQEVSEQDIERVIDAAKAVAIPMDREVIHVLPQEFIIDGQDGIKEPLGISGVRLEARVHIVTGAVASAQNVVKCANKCGLVVRDLVFSGISSGSSVVSPEEQELGVCLVDIGGGTTDVAVYHASAVKHTTVIPLGGAHITNDIASGLRTPIAAAEKIKCEHGTALSHLTTGNPLSDDETLDVPSTGGHPERIISKGVLADIIEPRIHEIFSVVNKELTRAGCKELLTSGLVLCGGTASLSGICQIGQEVLGLPVRTGIPNRVSGVTDLVRMPAYASAVGLIDYAARSRSVLHIDMNQSKVGRTVKRVAQWFGEHF